MHLNSSTWLLLILLISINAARVFAVFHMNAEFPMSIFCFLMCYYNFTDSMSELHRLLHVIKEKEKIRFDATRLTFSVVPVEQTVSCHQSAASLVRL